MLYRRMKTNPQARTEVALTAAAVESYNNYTFDDVYEKTDAASTSQASNGIYINLQQPSGPDAGAVDGADNGNTEDEMYQSLEDDRRCSPAYEVLKPSRPIPRPRPKPSK